MTDYTCLTCGESFTGFGNNPSPLPDSEGRKVCSDCNALYVIPARLGHPVEGRLYDEEGHLYGGFATEVPA